MKLLDVCRIGGRPVKKYAGLKKYIATGNIINNDIASFQMIEYNNKPSRANVEIQSNDVLFAKMIDTVKVLKANDNNINNIYSTGFYCITPNDNVLQDYLYLYFNSEYFNLQKNKYCAGATQKAINNDGLSKINIRNLPTIEDQKSIVKKIYNIENLIKIKKDEILKLESLIKSQFVEMFGDYKSIFQNWNNALVNDIADVTVGIVITPSKYYTDSNGVKTFRSLNIGKMKIKDTDWVYLSKEGNQINQKSILKENQVLVVRSGKPGVSCVITKEYEGCNAIDVIITTPSIEKINPVYLASFTNYEPGMNQIINGQNGVAQKHFNVKSYQNLKIALPPIDLQNQFAQIVEQIDKQKFEFEKSLKKLEELQASLMQEYFG